MNPSSTGDPLQAAISGLTHLWAQRHHLVVEVEYLADPEGAPGLAGPTGSTTVDGLTLSELVQLSLQAMYRPEVHFLYVCLDVRHPTQWRLEVADDTLLAPSHAQDISTLDASAWEQLAARLQRLPVQWSIHRAPVEGRLLVLQARTTLP